jgi:hypothetical protein
LAPPLFLVKRQKKLEGDGDRMERDRHIGSPLKAANRAAWTIVLDEIEFIPVSSRSDEVLS